MTDKKDNLLDLILSQIIECGQIHLNFVTILLTTYNLPSTTVENFVGANILIRSMPLLILNHSLRHVTVSIEKSNKTKIYKKPKMHKRNNRQQSK